MIEQLPLWDLSVPIDLASRGWRRHPIKPEWLLLEEPGAPGIICSGNQTFEGAIASARKCEAVWADMAAAKAAYEAQKTEKQTKRKKVAA